MDADGNPRRERNDQRHMKHWEVQAVRVTRNSAVITEMLTVIRGEDDECVPQHAPALQLAQQNSHLRVEVRDGAIV
jgi:hypothetical protein